ncbi:MAG: TonB C-terminal domain-containing protein [Bryobacter sp.]|jgi:TonB family protein|nr:TonB C-terminal domain-containing protein [Bryobacter sp. CoA8 C33]
MPVTLPSDSTDRPLDDLNLIRDWDQDSYRPRLGLAGSLSVLVHAVLGLAVFMAPRSIFESNPPLPIDARVVERKVTTLVAPRFELTQKEPNKSPIKPEVNLDDLTASLQNRRAPRTYVPPPTAPRKEQDAPRPVEAPPQLETTAPDARPLAQLGAPQLPQIEARALENKRSPFEIAGQTTGAKKGPEDGRIPVMQRQSVDELMRQSIQGTPGSSGQVVTDIPSQSNPLQPQSQIGSALELLSDPQGVDFRPYMKRILAIVRRNWFAVIPESARFGRRGRTLIQFSISKDGRVPKLVISGPSGAEALDRAAVAGISASNPFPPLPVEFKGEVIRLQFAFSYNMQ